MSSNKLNDIAAERLRVLAPEVYEECEQLVSPPVKDVHLLPAVLDELMTRYEPTPENSPFILSVVYYLYAPYKLHYQSLRGPNNIRRVVADAFKWQDKETVNYYGSILIAYYKNPRFAARVKETAEDVLRVINESKADILDALKAIE